MSGWNRRRQVFGLTCTKANYWLRRKDLGLKPWPDREWVGDMNFFVELFRKEGIEVVRVERAFIEVKALPGRVWEVLSGERSSPEHEGYYLR